jgi:RND family efflux transporter MFP subunit
MPRTLSVFFIAAILACASYPLPAQTPVSVVEPQSGRSEETLRLTGNLTARQVAGLSAQEAGLISVMHVDAGDTVEAGDVLVELDAGLVEQDVARAAAARDEARASLAEARRLAEEAQRLSSDRLFPETDLRSRESAVALAEAALARAESELVRERERLERHRLIAPFDGVIGERYVERGEWIEPGTAAVELVRVDELWLDVRVPQRYWGDLGRTEDVSVRAWADVAPDRDLDAEMHARVPVSDPTARTFLLRLLIDDDSGAITPGMSAGVEVTLRRDETSQRVPRDAILRYPDGTTTVWIVETGDNRAREVEVTVRRNVGDRVELTGELPEGARVVVRGNEVLSEGETVRIVGEDN